MRIFVAVNRIDEIGYRQTTALLIAAFVRLGHTVSLAGVADFSVDTSHEQSSSENGLPVFQSTAKRCRPQAIATQKRSRTLQGPVR